LRSRANLLRIVKKPGPRSGPVLEATSEFDSWYNLPSGIKTDYNGNSATIVLTSDHRETERVTKGGKVERFTVNEFGMFESHTAIDGIVQSQTYTPEGFIKTKSVGPLTTTYSYAPNSGVTSDQTLRGLPSQVIDPEGIPTDFIYDERNQLVRQARAGLEVTHAYNAQGDEVETRTTVDSGRVVIETKDYNQLGFMTSRTIREIETDGQTVDLTTTYIPDALNRVKEMIAPAGDRHVIEYDAQGRQQSYEIVGVYKESYGYDANGNQTSKTVGSATEHYFFDGHDRMVKVQTPTGAEVRVGLDGNDNLTNKVVIDVGGQILSDSTYFVDAFNRYTRVERRHEDGISAMQYEYVPEQRKIVMTDALGAVSTVFYDTAGREVRTETPTKTNVKTYDDNNNIIRRELHESGKIYVDRYDYNSLNQLTNVTDNAGFSSSILVGLDGRVKITTDREGHQQTNQYTLLGELSADITANAVATKYGYDTNRHINQISDTADRATKQIFHPAGQLLTTILPHQQQIKYTNFTPLLQPKRIEMPRGVIVDLAYDAEGRMTNRVLSGFGPSRTESYAYDGMQRPKLLQDPNSKVEFTYDKFEVTREFKHEYTFLENPPATATLQFSVKQQADKAGNRSSLTYPTPSITVTNRRDITGRLTALVPNAGEPILNDTEYAGDRMIGTRILGNNRITVENAFDAVKRTTARRYVRNSDNKALVDIRYAYDKSGAQLARQYIHRGGRADFYRYDAGYRLRRADVGVRPALGTAEGTRTISGFAIPPGVSGNWTAGLFAREFNFDNADLFTTTVTLNPDGLLLAPMPATYGAVDDLLHVGSLDGFARERDEVGNVTRTMLAVRIPGNPTPQLVPVSLSYNALGQLVLVSRDDGVQIVNEYNILGVRIRRQVTGPANLCVPSDVAFLYDGGNLIEIRDLNNAGAVIGRYYYSDDGDELLAGDISLNGGPAQRHYFLSDTLRSVMAVTDAQGGVIERVNYDAWGQPSFQSADSAAPTVSRVTRDGNSLLVEFTEPVLPVAGATQTTNIVPTLGNPASVFTIRAGSQTLSVEVRFEENFAGAAFGSVYRVTPSQALSGAVELTVLAGGLQDEWGNANSAQTLNLTIGASTTLFTGPARGSTAPVQLSRSSIESPFLFHGQVYDYESGLLYCRARFYDTYAGLFLQRDPAGYVDGVNQYAGFANNPVNLRDPSGMSVDELGRELSLIGSQASYNEDGIVGAAVGSVLESVGAVLQLGTGAAEGIDLLESGKPGTWGLLDALHGAELLTADLKTAFATGASLHNLMRSVAGRIEGYVLRRQTKNLNMPLHKRILYGKGWHGVEPDAIVKTMKEMNVTELSVREFGQKAAGRRIAGDLGYSKKPGFVATKTSGPLSTVTHEHWDVHSANIWEKTYTGDLDLFSMKVNGRRATPAEVNRFITRANINYAKMWRKAGNTGVPNVPFRHGAHFHLADMYGQSSGGKIVDNKLIKKIGHPGDTVSIRIDGFGRVSAYSTPRSQIRAEILESEVILKALQREDYGLRGGFPKNWHTWPE
jgi:RHS repeat-associated protein